MLELDSWLARYTTHTVAGLVTAILGTVFPGLNVRFCWGTKTVRTDPDAGSWSLSQICSTYLRIFGYFYTNCLSAANYPVNLWMTKLPVRATRSKTLSGVWGNMSRPDRGVLDMKKGVKCMYSLTGAKSTTDLAVSAFRPSSGANTFDCFYEWRAHGTVWSFQCFRLCFDLQTVWLCKILLVAGCGGNSTLLTVERLQRLCL
jgi:hypothetical protein